MLSQNNSIIPYYLYIYISHILSTKYNILILSDNRTYHRSSAVPESGPFG